MANKYFLGYITPEMQGNLRKPLDDSGFLPGEENLDGFMNHSVFLLDIKSLMNTQLAFRIYVKAFFTSLPIPFPLVEIIT